MLSRIFILLIIIAAGQFWYKKHPEDFQKILGLIHNNQSTDQTQINNTNAAKTTNPESPANGIYETSNAVVTLYSASWCGYCNKLRKTFKSQGIPYNEYDVEQSEQGKTFSEKQNIEGVPTTVYADQTVIEGYDPDQLNAKFRQLGYSLNL